MAKKTVKPAPTAEPVTPESPAAESPAPLEVEFPAEIVRAAAMDPLAAPPAEAVGAEIVPEGAPVVPASPVEPTPAPAVTQPKPGSLLAQLEEVRQQYRAAMARVEAARAGKAEAIPAYEFQLPADHDPDQDPDLKTVLKKAGSVLGRQVLEQVQARLTTALGRLHAEQLTQNIIRSNTTWMRMLPDYREVVTSSGVQALLEVGADGRPAHPDKFDPVVRDIWARHPEPALFAYELGQEILARAASPTTPARTETPARGTVTPIARAAALRAGLEEAAALEKAAARPQGIQALPAAASGATRRVITSVRDLTDAERAYLMEHKPEVWQTLKRRAVGLA